MDKEKLWELIEVYKDSCEDYLSTWECGTSLDVKRALQFREKCKKELQDYIKSIPQKQ